MAHQSDISSPRLDLLRREVEQIVLKPFRTHGWSISDTSEYAHEDLIKITAQRGMEKVRIAILYSSSGISNLRYRALGNEVDHIFFHGQPYMLESFAAGVTIPVVPLSSFFPFLVALNKRIEPDRSPQLPIQRPKTVKRLTAEQPIDAVFARLQQFTSVNLAAKLVKRRAADADLAMTPEVVASKSTGIAFSLRSALDYIVSTPGDRLNKRVLGLYYGTMAFAQAEMLASPSGPIDLDEVEGMTKQGHGLYTLAGPNGVFSDLRIGVLATGFLPQWASFLGYDITNYPTRKARSFGDIEKQPQGTVCSLRDLFSSVPEIDDLFSEVFNGAVNWLSVRYDDKTNMRFSVHGMAEKKYDSTYGLFHDRSGEISVERLSKAGWPLAEIQRVEDFVGPGTLFRARVDHAGHDVWWSVLPTHSSPFGTRSTLLLPTVGGLRDYRTIVAVTLYALSIMARYMPSAWRRIEGGDDDQYLALIKASLSVWERVLPEHFLESIAGEIVHTAQPGSFFG